MANMVRNTGDRSAQPSTGRSTGMTPGGMGTSGGWDPFRLMRELVGGDAFRDLEGYVGLPRQWNPSFDVKETPNAFVIRADVPGLDEKDLEIQVSGNRLTISGRREFEERREDEAFVSVERAHGTFSRAWTLPDSIASDRISADLKQGVLTLELPKRPEVQPRKISVKSIIHDVKAAVTGKGNDGDKDREQRRE